jgi:hypothetical protein
VRSDRHDAAEITLHRVADDRRGVFFIMLLFGDKRNDKA